MQLTHKEVPANSIVRTIAEFYVHDASNHNKLSGIEHPLGTTRSKVLHNEV